MIFMNTKAWNETRQDRLTILRLRKLSGSLTEIESAELKQMMAEILSDDDLSMSQALANMQQELDMVQTQLKEQQAHNAELAQLALQQEQLATDAAHAFTNLEQRQLHIYQQYTRLTRESPAP